MDLARFIWELLGAVQILVDAVKQGFSDSRVEVDSLDRPWFRFC